MLCLQTTLKKDYSVTCGQLITMSCTFLHRNATLYKSVVSYVIFWESERIGCVKEGVDGANQTVYFLNAGCGSY